MVTIHSIETIVSDSTLFNGDPVIAGTRIRVIDIVASHLYRGLTPDALATNFKLDLSQVYAALSYYYQHKATFDKTLREQANKTNNYLQQLEAQGKLIRRD